MEKRPGRDSRPQEASVSVAQKWVLGGREQFHVAAFSATRLTQGAPPHPTPSPSVLSTVGATYHAGYKPHGPSLLCILSTAGLHVVGEDRYRRWSSKRHRVSGIKDRTYTQGTGVWFAAWPLMPGSEKVAELRRDRYRSPEFFSAGSQSQSRACLEARGRPS